MVLADWVTALAASGGGALLGAAATDAWQTARAGIVRLFERTGQGRQELVAEWLDEDAAAIGQAGAAERDQVRQRLLPAWQTRLADLLAEYSGAAGERSDVANELRDWREAVRAQWPARRQTWVMTITARDGLVLAAQGGDVNYHGSATPPLSRPSGTDDADEPPQ
jgi:hypothetical protein